MTEISKRGRTFVVGDIHGAHKALLQCLERSGFNNDKDTLIQLGDVADGWNEVRACVDELLKIKNLISIKGNHDEWFCRFIMIGVHPDWTQGGAGTWDSYLPEGEDVLKPTDIPEEHMSFFVRQRLYYIDDKNRCFVHGGFNRHYEIQESPSHVYYWDRDLWNAAMSWESMTHKSKDLRGFRVHNNFEEIFIGHTSTEMWGKTEPMKAAMVWNLDTGAGWTGKLTIMDVDTKEYWQSDNVTSLYPDQRGRS